jgi:cation-transporting ATPase E
MGNTPTISPHPDRGLSHAEAEMRRNAGLSAGAPKAAGRTKWEIVLHHSFTFFNLVFVILAVLLLLGGSSVKNMGFLPVAACNTLIGIFQELRAKAAVDKLTLIAARPVRILREGQLLEIPQPDICRDDIAEFVSGDQLPADGILRTGELQMDESLLTGESDPITKIPGDKLLSGSFVLAGTGRAQLTAVGEKSYAAALTLAAKADPKAEKSEMMASLDKLILVLGLALIPVGYLLFRQEYWILKLSMQKSVEGTVAALVGMIPEGLYLLTSMAMAASALKLSRSHVLVQDMNCIESLARADVLCVDKTGTITQPDMEFQKCVPLDGAKPREIDTILTALYSGVPAENDTSRALISAFSGKTDWICTRRIPFTSKAKWSGGVFEKHGAYLVGAPEFLLGNRLHPYEKTLRAHAESGSRVLLLAKYDGDPVPGSLDGEKLTPLALLLLNSPIRPEAAQTFRYFAQQGVSIRVISGDDPRTASHAAQQAGIENSHLFVDASTLKTDKDILSAVKRYTVFGRVTPDQKKSIISALQKLGHTVAMTGDGVNDLLAMKQADCSVAMASGAQAASQIASLVLLDSDFGGMPDIVGEGRRVIHNIQRSAALFLVKNIFSLGLALSALVTGLAYPFMPLHLTVIGALTIGIPSFFLALEPNYIRVEGSFLKNVLKSALPGGLTDLICILLTQFVAYRMGLSHANTSTLCAAVVAVTGIAVLFTVSRPFRPFRAVLLVTMAAALVGSFTLLGSFFDLTLTGGDAYWLLTGILLATPTVFWGIRKLFAPKR